MVCSLSFLGGVWQIRCCGYGEGVFGRQFNHPAKPCICQLVKIQKTIVLCIPWFINKPGFSRDPKYYPFRRYDNWRWGKGVELSQSGTKEQTVFLYTLSRIYFLLVSSFFILQLFFICFRQLQNCHITVISLGDGTILV